MENLDVSNIFRNFALDFGTIIVHFLEELGTFLYNKNHFYYGTRMYI